MFLSLIHFYNPGHSLFPQLCSLQPMKLTFFTWRRMKSQELESGTRIKVVCTLKVNMLSHLPHSHLPQITLVPVLSVLGV